MYLNNCVIYYIKHFFVSSMRYLMQMTITLFTKASFFFFCVNNNSKVCPNYVIGNVTIKPVDVVEIQYITVPISKYFRSFEQ